MNILGLNFNHADSSASLLIDGQLVSAADEERFVRIKHYSGFPINAFNYCLNNSNIEVSDLDFIAVNFDPKANIKNKFFYALKNLDKGSTYRKIFNFTNKLNVKNELENFLLKKNFNGKIINVEHHMSHLASSYFLSNFSSSVGLTLDGFGDFCSTESFICDGNRISSKKKVHFPHSLGIFYQAITQYLGFKKYGDEYKVMGLASYGKPTYLEQFEKIISFSENDYFNLNLDYFKHHTDINFKYSFPDGIPNFTDLYSAKLVNLLGQERNKENEINDHHKNIAASMQKCFENLVIKILNKIYDENPNDNLCLAGGCALNSKLNGILKRKTKFKNIFIQPNAGDGGGSLGAAMYVCSKLKDYDNLKKNNNKVYLGPSFSNSEIQNIIKHREDLKNLSIENLNDDKINNLVAKKIFENCIIGWFKGSMEWGPRALGNRSILANPTNHKIKDILNLKIKLREKFRPFAPAILEEHQTDYFDLDYHSPFMMNVVNAKDKAKKEVPSVVHVDNTCRVQTVRREENKQFYDLIKEFFNISGVPILLNTSFNENEPIVLSPQHAIDCFIRTKMDVLVLENWVISR